MCRRPGQWSQDSDLMVALSGSISDLDCESQLILSQTVHNMAVDVSD